MTLENRSTTFIPDGYTPFRKAVFLVTENPSSGDFVGWLTDEQKTILQNYETESEKAKREFRIEARDGKRIKIVNQPVVTKEISGARAKKENLAVQCRGAEDRIRNWCFRRELVGLILTKEGRTHSIPLEIWGGNRFEEIRREGTTRFDTVAYSETLSKGQVLFLISDIKLLIGLGAPEGDPEVSTVNTLPSVPATEKGSVQNGKGDTLSNTKPPRRGGPKLKGGAEVDRCFKLMLETRCGNDLNELQNMFPVGVENFYRKYFGHEDRRLLITPTTKSGKKLQAAVPTSRSSIVRRRDEYVTRMGRNNSHA